jgi:hypothetical protein
MKLDCEGAEWELLRECPEIFSSVTVLVAEIHEDTIDGRSPGDFRQAMRSAGFSLLPHVNLVIGTRGPSPKLPMTMRS